MNHTFHIRCSYHSVVAFLCQREVFKDHSSFDVLCVKGPSKLHVSFIFRVFHLINIISNSCHNSIKQDIKATHNNIVWFTKLISISFLCSVQSEKNREGVGRRASAWLFPIHYCASLNWYHSNVEPLCKHIILRSWSTSFTSSLSKNTSRIYISIAETCEREAKGLGKYIGRSVNTHECN